MLLKLNLFKYLSFNMFSTSNLTNDQVTAMLKANKIEHINVATQGIAVLLSW